MTEQTPSNHLADESSPYLLQHANNPVDWYPWGQEALDRARDEKLPIILSIGYSSCHWCHVMAHESFENEEVAQLMNENFINIKLDREERPDIDNIYMDAIQAMGLRGGWPLNVFLTPDQKPFYGGTYFPTEQWKKLLASVSNAYQNNQEKLLESAEQFAQNLQQSEAEKYGLLYGEEQLTMSDFDIAFEQMSKNFDKKWGGMKRAPKFPMPCLWNYLASYSQISGNHAATDHLLLTLDKMAYGGIFDQIGGGFSRYSVDGEWHVPHFEKMLYDNGQLLSLYAHGYQISQNEHYRNVLLSTAQWMEREMLHESGGFFSALDADSEGEEGKYYVWTFKEVKELAGKDAAVITEYFDVSKKGNWENGVNVLRKLEADEKFAEELGMSPEELEFKVNQFVEKALTKRAGRIPPGIDSKIIAGWNGLALKGLCDAYQATGEDLFKRLAQKNLAFILEHLIVDEKLIRTFGKNTQGFLEDYAAVIQALIKYYETFFDEYILIKSKELTQRVIDEFYDDSENLFFYSSKESEQLIARKKELFDNVIPASNSIMAENIYKLGLMLDIKDYQDKAAKMIAQVNKLIKVESEHLSNWANLALLNTQPTAEVIIVGEAYESIARELQMNFIPNKIIMGSSKMSSLPLFEHKKPTPDQTTIYVCFDKVCQRPVQNVTEALKMIHEGK